MAFAKIILNGTTLMDVTDNTVTAARLQSGYTGTGADGNPVNGTLVFATYYTGTAAPSSSLGANGDVYLQTGS